jgi:hypothetical protein
MSNPTASALAAVKHLPREFVLQSINELEPWQRQVLDVLLQRLEAGRIILTHNPLQRQREPGMLTMLAVAEHLQRKRAYLFAEYIRTGEIRVPASLRAAGVLNDAPASGESFADWQARRGIT